MKRVLMVNGITDAFGTCESRRFAEGRCVPMVERAIRGRVDPRLGSELALDSGLDFS
jgi:hypothetical protein